MTDTTLMLSVYMLTYNHGKFIEEAIKSVVNQEVDFAYELVIGDDASSDETQSVCEKYAQLYPDIIRYIRRAQNLGAAKNSTQVLDSCRGKYLARLEGDDFMMGRGRLQAQVQWLEEHPDCMLVYGQAQIIDESRTVHGVIPVEQRCFSGDVLDKMVVGNLIPACTAVYRAEILKQLPEWRSLVRYGDYVANTLAADKGSVHCIPEVISCYRRHGSSMTAGERLEDNAQQLMDIHQHFIVNNDLSSRGIALSREALIRKLELLYEQSGRNGVYIPWAELRERYAPCFDVDSELANRFNKLLDGILISKPPAASEVSCLFSIVLTTYNRPTMLMDALRSVQLQTLQDFEVILVNDHGDHVEAMLEKFSFPLTYIYKGSNQGLSAARNTGLALAQGRYVCYLDDDDLYLPDHLAVLAKEFETQPGAVIYTGVEYVTEEIVESERKMLERSEPYQHDQFDKERLFIHNYIPVNTWSHPRDLIKDVGEFDTGLTAFEDWDMLMRLAALRPMLHIPQVTAQVRIRQGEGSDGDHMLGRERDKFAALYQEMYRRHSDLGSERVRHGRSSQLRSLGVAPQVDPTPVLTWLAARKFTPVQQRQVKSYTQQQKTTAAQLMAVIIDLDSDLPAVTQSLNSLQLELAVTNVSSLVISAAVAPVDHEGKWLQIGEHTWVASLNNALASASADWIILLRAGDEFASSGLQMVSLELQANPDCRAIYADGLYRQEASDYGLALRPDFNLDYLLSFPQGMSQHWLFNRENVVSLGGFDAHAGDAMELDLILRLVNQHGLTGMGHVPEPLVLSQAPVLRDSALERSVIKTHLAARGYPDAFVNSALPGQYRIDYGHADKPLVSIVVVSDELAATQRCVMSVLENTGYAAYEILLIDNASRDSATLEWLAALEQMDTALVKILRSSERLSQSDANNQAALNANGDYLLLLDPEVAVINESWLSELMNHAQRPEVGVVGACTVNADGKITHAGLVLGLEGPAGEVFLGEPLGSPGYMQRLQVDRNVSAVSGSCMLIRKSLYIDLSGMDATTFADQGAALDLCLRVTNGGHMIVWTPRTTLLHSAYKPGMRLETEDMLYARWLARLARDPAYNPNFSLSKQGGYKLADPQISWRPLDVWRPLPVVLAHPADVFGCGHYRVIQPFKALREAGLLDGALSQGLMHVTDLERYAPDVVVLQRQISDERLEAIRRMKAFSQAFKVYELDDYLPNLPIKNAHRNAMPKDIVKSLKRGLSLVDRFIVSTDSLAEAFSGFHDDIRVVQNRLDPLWWENLPSPIRGQSTKPRVGWAGGASHTGDLELIFDLVKDLADEVEWIFFGMCPDKLRPYVHEYHPGVAIEHYPRKLASLNLDLAVAPVEENLFNECKSNLRLLEYGACSYPVVCSDIRCYSGALPVTRVKNRYRDWMEAIRSHLADPAASAAQGRELHLAVKADWMLIGGGLEEWRREWLP